MTTEKETQDLRGRRFKIKNLSPEAKKAIDLNIRANRYAHNFIVAELSKSFEEINAERQEGEPLKYPGAKQVSEAAKKLTIHRNETWLKQTDSNIASGITQGIKRTISMFSKSIRTEQYKRELAKKVEKLKGQGKSLRRPMGMPGWPKFKRWSSIGSYYTRLRPVTNEDGTVSKNKIFLPKIGNVELFINSNKNYALPETWQTDCRVSTDGINYYVSVIAPNYRNEEIPSTDEVLGIDVGCRKGFVSSSGDVLCNPADNEEALRLEKLVNYYNKKLSKHDLKSTATYTTADGKEYKKKSNKHWRLFKLKRKREIELLNYKTKTYERDIKELLTKIRPKVVVVESLKVKNLFQNDRIAATLQRSAMYTRLSALKSCCNNLGISIHVVSQKYASSQLCNHCGYKHTEMKKGYETFRCPNCGQIIDRDLNAALNLRQAYFDGLTELAD